MDALSQQHAVATQEIELISGKNFSQGDFVGKSVVLLWLLDAIQY